jgi:hypothetical protein
MGAERDGKREVERGAVSERWRQWDGKREVEREAERVAADVQAVSASTVASGSGHGALLGQAVGAAFGVVSQAASVLGLDSYPWAVSNSARQQAAPSRRFDASTPGEMIDLTVGSPAAAEIGEDDGDSHQ